MKMDFFTWHTAVKTHLGSIEMSQWHVWSSHADEIKKEEARLVVNSLPLPCLLLSPSEHWSLTFLFIFG
jgi:hypothetical protein